MASLRKSQESRTSRKPPAGSKHDRARCEPHDSHRSPRSNQKFGSNPTLAGLQSLSADADRGLRGGLPGGFKQLRQVRTRIADLLTRIDRLNNQINYAYGGQMFLPKFSPVDTRNQQRSNAYLWQLKKVGCLLSRALKLWRMAYGCDTEGI